MKKKENMILDGYYLDTYISAFISDPGCSVASSSYAPRGSQPEMDDDGCVSPGLFGEGSAARLRDRRMFPQGQHQNAMNNDQMIR